MEIKLLVTLNTPSDAQTVKDSGCRIIAQYPDSLLAECSEEQLKALRQSGIEVNEVERRPVRSAGNTFDFEKAVEADAVAPIALDPNRTAYFLVRLVGPASPDWLDALKSYGAEIYSNVSGNTLLAGMLPSAAGKISKEAWVEGVAPYRPAMKLSPKLRSGMRKDLTTRDLTRSEAPDESELSQEMIEINVFPKESINSIASEVRKGGGSVLSETRTSLTALVPAKLIPKLAEINGIQSILPRKFEKFHNDRALEVMGVPAGSVFGDTALKGSGQIVAVCDSGLDTGNAATIHRDFSGRILDITSWPIKAGLRELTNNVPPFDDGPADTHSGHGTHVSGSVLGSGFEAQSHDSAFIPRGAALEAQIFFQAVEQSVLWKSAAELRAMGIAPPDWWPPEANSLWGLPESLDGIFDAAYTAGARIHTNSWGSPDEGTYTETSASVDNFMWKHRDMLILFSAGNEGIDNNGDGIIDSDSIGSPGTAKNCLTVGACENNRPHGSIPSPGLDVDWFKLKKYPKLKKAGHVSDNPAGMAAFSSRGPTDDGRIKPDVVAPGTNVLSTRTSAFVAQQPDDEPLWGDMSQGEPLRGLYCWSGGTSMSTPLVAGAAAVVRHHLIQQRGHFKEGIKPSGALIKAFIVNGAVEIAGQFDGEVPDGRNIVSGFGRVNVNGSLVPGAANAGGLHQTHFVDDPTLAVETGQMVTFKVTPEDGAMPLKVTLVWTDAPAPAGIGGLVNRLYLQVVRPDGSVIDGDVRHFPSVSNNVQQVVIKPPLKKGTYTIRVRGVSVIKNSPSTALRRRPRQDFALAVSNAKGSGLV